MEAVVWAWLVAAVAGVRVERLPLGPDSELRWVSPAPDRLALELRLPLLTPPAWAALGFSDRGLFTQADFCILLLSPRGATLEDVWTDDKGLVHVDDHQDCNSLRITAHGNHTSFAFDRLLNTCDPQDYFIERGTTHVLWAWGVGSGPGVMPGGGMTRVQLVRPPLPVAAPGASRRLLVTADKVAVPSADTTYWCHMAVLPEYLTLAPHHIVKFEASISGGSESLVHHMELFHCERWQEDVSWRGPCDSPTRPATSTSCKKVLAAWAMGAPPFYYPKVTGLPVGGKDFIPHVMLEIHYNNPDQLVGLVDSSGMAVEVTSVLRQHDAGVIELGLEYIDKMAIPPRQPAFTLSGYCIPECTSVAVPTDGVQVFGSQLHTHLTGTRVETRHYRAGKELPLLNWDPHYSTHYQEIRLLPSPVTLLPGDSLITTCTYDTSERENVTLGGFAIRDEMCVNYIYYYPKIDLEVCKSSISSTALGEYFDAIKRLEIQKTGSHLPISEAYGGIEWSPLRALVLHELYLDSPIYMQCNRSSGERFPGDWSEMPLPPILQPLPPAPTPCSII